MGFLDGGLSGIAAGVGGALSGVSNFFGNQSALDFSRKQFEYQKEMAKNQLQWRVEDAKKAGLHPMAALGLGASSFSPVGVSQSPYDFSWIGQMGQSADYAAAKAKDSQEQQEAKRLMQAQAFLQSENLQLQNDGLRLDNEFRQWKMQQAMSGATTQGLNGPSGPSLRNSSLIPGQDDSPPIKGSVPSGDPMYQFMETSVPGVYTLQPGSDWSQVYEDKGFPLEQWPLVKSNAVDYAGRVTGRIINGMVYSDTAGGWVKADSKLGKEALASFSSRARRFAGDWWREMKNVVRFYNR